MPEAPREEIGRTSTEILVISNWLTTRCPLALDCKKNIATIALLVRRSEARVAAVPPVVYLLCDGKPSSGLLEALRTTQVAPFSGRPPLSCLPPLPEPVPTEPKPQ
jgi:hypothetical protein